MRVGDLREGPVDHRDVIGGGVRSGVPGAQHDRERFARLVDIRGERVKPIAVLVGPGRLLLLHVAVIDVASTSIVNRRGARGQLQNRSRARACAARTPVPAIPAPTAIRSTIGSASSVQGHLAEQRLLLPDRGEIQDALTAMASIAARSQITRPGS